MSHAVSNSIGPNNGGISGVQISRMSAIFLIESNFEVIFCEINLQLYGVIILLLKKYAFITVTCHGMPFTRSQHLVGGAFQLYS